MNISPNGLSFLKDREGYKEEAYRDSAGIWTIGYGTIYIYGRKVRKGDTCTKNEAEDWLIDHIQETEGFISLVVKKIIKQNQFDSLVSFVYNIGINGFKTSTLLKVLNKNGPKAIYSDLFTRWNKVTINGKKVVVNGLTNRRKLEYQLFIRE